jgi:hypothetical protein
VLHLIPLPKDARPSSPLAGFLTSRSIVLQNISTTTGSKDMQMVSLTLRVMSRPDTRHLSTIYRSLGLDYDERVLPSIGNEVLKATVAQFDAAELITQREVVSSRIREDLLKRAGEFNIVLEDVSIVSAALEFSHILLPALPLLAIRLAVSHHRSSAGPSLPSFAEQLADPKNFSPSLLLSHSPSCTDDHINRPT